MSQKNKKKVEKVDIEEDYFFSVIRDDKTGLYNIVCYRVEGEQVVERLVSRGGSQRFAFADLMLLAKGMLEKGAMPAILKSLQFK